MSVNLTLKVLLIPLALIFAACPSGPQSPSPQIVQQPQPGDTVVSDTLMDSIAASVSDLSSSLNESSSSSSSGAGINRGTILGVISISSPDEFEGDFALEQLIFVLVQSGLYRVVERRDLDIIMAEQNFQLSGYVDDDTAVSIGRLAGAGIVITGSILPYGSARYLNLRALDVQTGQIRAVSSRPFISSF